MGQQLDDRVEEELERLGTGDVRENVGNNDKNVCFAVGKHVSLWGSKVRESK